MAEQRNRGSIILKVLIVALILVLTQVIYIPDGIWKDENYMEKTSRENMNAIYEAQRFYQSRTQSFVPADSLEKLIAFIQQDTSLNKRRKVSELTNVLTDGIDNVMQIPSVDAVLPIMQSLDEIRGDLSFNTRYFQKYDNIMSLKDNLSNDLNKFFASGDFPNFSYTMNYVDSLNSLKDRINDYRLQNAALLSQRYVDSLANYMNRAERDQVQSFWTEYEVNLNEIISAIKATDIEAVSSVGDRLKKFRDRISTAMTQFTNANQSADITALRNNRAALTKIYEQFIAPKNFNVTQGSGLVQLSEIDSTLLKLKPGNFYCPDNYDGEQRYLQSYKPGSSYLLIESPNLLDNFQKQLQTATAPLSNMGMYGKLDKIKAHLDSTVKVMNAAKDQHKLSRYSTDVLLNMKELIAEMNNVNSALSFRYGTMIKSFVDTLKTEKKLSYLRPTILGIVNPMDTLAARMESGNVSDLQEKLTYFGVKIGKLDSLIQVSVPARIRRQVAPFKNVYDGILPMVSELKASFNTTDAANLRTASKQIFDALETVSEGVDEPIYVVFAKKHINHGYIENGRKSWEDN